MRRFTLSTTLVLGLLLATGASAICPDEDCSPSADTYLVRQDCTGLQDCFESVSLLSGRSALTCGNSLRLNPSVQIGTVQGHESNPASCETNGWLWTTRTPSAASPVTIDVGVGTFEPFVCPRGQNGDLGHVTVRGAGREQTTFLGLGPDLDSVGIDAAECEELVFSDLRAEGVPYAIRWADHGEATWHRVDMVANTALTSSQMAAVPWDDECNSSGSARSEHFIYDSRAFTIGPEPTLAIGYVTNCAETYFFGGSIQVSTEGGKPGIGLVVGLNSNASPDGPPRFLGFGTQILVQGRDLSQNLSLGSSIPGLEDGVGIVVSNGSTVELHDSAVRVDIRPEPGKAINATAVRTIGGAGFRRYGTSIEATTTSGISNDEESQ